MSLELGNVRRKFLNLHWKKTIIPGFHTTWQWAFKIFPWSTMLNLQKTLATVLGNTILQFPFGPLPPFFGGFSVSLCYVDVSHKKATQLPKGYLKLRSPGNGPKPKKWPWIFQASIFRGQANFPFLSWFLLSSHELLKYVLITQATGGFLSQYQHGQLHIACLPLGFKTPLLLSVMFIYIYTYFRNLQIYTEIDPVPVIACNMD